MVKIQKASGDQHMVTIPKELRKAMGWEKGTEIQFEVIDDKSLEMKEDEK